MKEMKMILLATSFAMSIFILQGNAVADGMNKTTGMENSMKEPMTNTMEENGHGEMKKMMPAIEKEPMHDEMKKPMKDDKKTM